MISHYKAIWAAPPVSGGALLVLLALAWHADETDNTCYPGIARLMDMTQQSERGVQNALRQLRDLGVVRIENGNGRKNTNRYTLQLKTPQMVTAEGLEHTPEGSVETPQIVTPETSAPPQMLTLTPQMVPETPQIVAKNPATSAPKQLRNTKEPPVETPKGFLLPEWVPRKQWNAFEKSRQRMRVPLTDEARELSIGKLKAFVKEGYSPEEILELAIEKGWRSLYKPSTPPRNGAQHGNTTDTRYHPPHGSKTAASNASSVAALERRAARRESSGLFDASGTGKAGGADGRPGERLPDRLLLGNY